MFRYQFPPEHINILSQQAFSRRMGFYHQKPPMVQNYLIFTTTKEETFNFPHGNTKKKKKRTLSRRFVVWREFQEIAKQGKGWGNPALALTLRLTSYNSHSSQTFLSRIDTCRTAAYMGRLQGSRKGSWLHHHGQVSHADRSVYKSCEPATGSLLLPSGCLG